MKVSVNRITTTFRLKSSCVVHLNNLVKEMNEISNLDLNKTDIINFIIINAAREGKEKLLKDYVKCIA